MEAIKNSIIRTLVPIIVGFLLTWVLRLGIDIDQATLTTVVQAVLTGLYYVVVRFIEQYKPKVGILLGKATPPSY